MSRYLLIESRDPFESQDSVRFLLATASELSTAGHAVTMFLIQNGALAARDDVQLPALSAALRAGVEVIADEFSLRERGIGDRQRSHSVSSASLNVVIERLALGDRVFWH